MQTLVLLLQTGLFLFSAKKNNEQTGAELGQAQVELEDIFGVVVEVVFKAVQRLKLKCNYQWVVG